MGFCSIFDQYKISNFYFCFHHQLAGADGSTIPRQRKALIVMRHPIEQFVLHGVLTAKTSTTPEGDLPLDLKEVAAEVKKIANFLNIDKFYIGGWSYSVLIAQYTTFYTRQEF